MRHYRHLSAEERDRMAEMYARHEGVSAIAAEIGRNKSTVSREIARNGRNGRYGAIAAQSRSDARRKACRPRKRLSGPALAAEVRRRIVDGRWSPEQMDGRFRLERGGRCVVSFSTICRAVNAGEGGVPFHFCQPHHPWQKPTVEDTNVLIRELFPKGTDFSRVTDEEVQEVFEKINDRPRKVLGFRTANEVYREMLHSA